jgi:uncharacterized membrane protein YsdA (DUF1294 family)
MGRGCGLHVFFTLLMIGVGIWVLLGSNLPFYQRWLLALSIVTFGYYWFDKYQARHKGWRVPEVWLHVLAFLGGFLGGWAALFIIGHKRDELFFFVILFLATLLHIGLIAYGIVEMGPHGV